MLCEQEGKIEGVVGSWYKLVRTVRHGHANGAAGAEALLHVVCERSGVRKNGEHGVCNVDMGRSGCVCACG